MAVAGADTYVVAGLQRRRSSCSGSCGGLGSDDGERGRSRDPGLLLALVVSPSWRSTLFGWPPVTGVAMPVSGFSCGSCLAFRVGCCVVLWCCRLLPVSVRVSLCGWVYLRVAPVGVCVCVCVCGCGCAPLVQGWLRAAAGEGSSSQGAAAHVIACPGVHRTSVLWQPPPRAHCNERKCGVPGNGDTPSRSKGKPGAVCRVEVGPVKSTRLVMHPNLMRFAGVVVARAHNTLDSHHTAIHATSLEPRRVEPQLERSPYK